MSTSNKRERRIRKRNGYYRSITKEMMCHDISRMTGIHYNQVRPVLETFVDLLAVYVSNEQKVRIHKLGTFTCKHMGEKTLKHPQTGKPLQVPPKRKIRFAPSDDFERRLKQEIPIEPDYHLTKKEVLEFRKRELKRIQNQLEDCPDEKRSKLLKIAAEWRQVNDQAKAK